MRCAVSRDFSTIGKCPASSIAPNSDPGIRVAAPSADFQGNWTSCRPERTIVGKRIRPRSAATEASLRLKAKPVAIYAFRRSRGFQAATIALTHASSANRGSWKTAFVRSFRTLFGSGARTKHGRRKGRYILAVRPGSFGVSPAASRTTTLATRSGRSSAAMMASVPHRIADDREPGESEGIDQRGDGPAVRRQGASFAREQRALALTREVRGDPRMAGPQDPRDGDPDLRPGGPSMEQEDRKSARDASLKISEPHAARFEESLPDRGRERLSEDRGIRRGDTRTIGHRPRREGWM